MNKIYIIGPCGSGKTALSKKLSKKLNIKSYELDKIVWDDDNGNIKRTPEEITKLFNYIISKDSWIIEDVGRKIFNNGIKEADIVYYIDLKPQILYIRIISRWIKQILRLEKYNYKPTLKSLLQLFRWVKNDIEKKEIYIEYIKNNSKEFKLLRRTDITKIIRKD